MTTRVQWRVDLGLSTPGELSTLISAGAHDGTRVGCMIQHGHGTVGVAPGFLPEAPGTITYFSQVAACLAENGESCTHADDGTPLGAAWANPAATTAISARAAWMKNNGYTTPDGKVDLIGFSMGGLTSLVWALQNPTLVRRILLVDPATDMRYFAPLNGGGYSDIYTAYGLSASPTQAQFTTATAGRRGVEDAAALAASGIPIRIWHLSDDTTVPSAQSQAYATAYAAAGGVCTVRDTKTAGATHALPLLGVSPSDAALWLQGGIAA